jgi:hypothetical protein
MINKCNKINETYQKILLKFSTGNSFINYIGERYDQYDLEQAKNMIDEYHSQNIKI